MSVNLRNSNGKPKHLQHLNIKEKEEEEEEKRQEFSRFLKVAIGPRKPLNLTNR